MEMFVRSDALVGRPLRQDEQPEPGDLHFAIGYGRNSALVSRIIAAGTSSRTNHVGVIARVAIDEWEIIEALSAGVVRNAHRPPPRSTVMRVSDAEQERLTVVSNASALSKPHIAYDWWTIARIIFVGLLGRAPFITIPLLVAPPLARYTNPVWVAPVLSTVLIVALYRARGVLFEAVMRVPWPDPKDRMICSEFVRRVLEATFGADAFPGLQGRAPSMTSPGDLLQALLGRSDYSTLPTGTPLAVADADQPREARQHVTAV